MKEKLILLSIFILTNIIACTKNNINKSNPDFSTNGYNDSIEVLKQENFNNIYVEKVKKDTSDNNIFYDERIELDTIINSYRIKYIIESNNDIVTKEGVYSDGEPFKDRYVDRSIWLSIKLNNKNIIYNKEINKHTFKDKITDEIEKYQLQGFEILKNDTNGITFYVYFCIPDTDVCYNFHLSVSNIGVLSSELIEEDSGE